MSQSDLHLEVGDVAYIVTSASWRRPNKVVILGPCEMGDGYQAILNGKEVIHTCDDEIFTKRHEAQRCVKENRIRLRKAWAEKQKEACQMVQFLDHLIAGGDYIDRDGA